MQIQLCYPVFFYERSLSTCQWYLASLTMKEKKFVISCVWRLIIRLNTIRHIIIIMRRITIGRIVLITIRCTIRFRRMWFMTINVTRCM